MSNDSGVSLNPTENVFVIRSASDLPDELDRYRLYHLTYRGDTLWYYNGSELVPVSGNYYLEVAKGNVTGEFLMHKFGRNPDVDTAAPEAIWNGGLAYTGFNAIAAETVEVFSSDANDTIAGTGARTVRLFGLDANFDRITEDIDMDGVTPVDTSLTYIRLDRARVLTAGSGGENAGAITARQNVTTANVFMVLPIGYNSTMIACYTIPNGFDGYFLAWTGSLSGGNNADAELRLLARPDGQTFQVQEEISIKAAGDSEVTRHFQAPKGPYAEKTDIYVEATAGANNMGIAAAFDLIMVANT